MTPFSSVSDPQWLYADPDPVFKVNADPDPALKMNTEPRLRVYQNKADLVKAPAPQRWSHVIFATLHQLFYRQLNEYEIILGGCAEKRNVAICEDICTYSIARGGHRYHRN
jgi:hypothetical protein